MTDLLEWRGPRALWSSDLSRCILLDSDAVEPGLYLWTVKVGSEYWVNYVGMSGTSIAQRQRVHIEEFLCGHYWIYDANSLSQGRKEAIYDPNKGLEVFLRKVHRPSPAA